MTEQRFVHDYSKGTGLRRGALASTRRSSAPSTRARPKMMSTVTNPRTESPVYPREQLLAPACPATTGRAKNGRAISFMLGRAWNATLALQVGEAVKIADAEAAIADLPPDVSHRYWQEVGTLRAAGLALRDESLAALSAVSAMRPRGNGFADSGAAATIQRFGYWKLGDIERFYAIGRQSRPGRLTKRQALQAVFDLSLDSAVELDRLRLPAAKRLAHDALALAEEFMSGNGAVAALPASLVAQVLYEEGYLDDAERMIGGRLPAIRASGMIEGAIRAYGVIARIAAHRRQPHLASMVLHEAEELGERRNWPRLVCTSIAGRLELLLQHQQIDDAEECAERLEGLALRRQSGDSLARAEMGRLAALGRCRVALARRQTRSAIATLRQARDDAASGADLHRSFQIRLLLVQALAVAGETEEATSILREALQVGATIGLYQAFLDGGSTIGRLLRQLYEQPLAGDDLIGTRPFIRSLLDRRPGHHGHHRERKIGFKSAHLLSEQERKILKHVSAGLSNKKIARALKITPETVKSHLKRIFVKLEVGTRAEAVARGDTFGLI
jgi:ATP/maltotriose-dependent transcriptional regulator MalT